MSLPADVIAIRTPQTSLAVLPCIKTRFSPRVFSSVAIPQTDLNTIIEAARLAPSARNHQPWFFYIIKAGSPANTRLFTAVPERNYWAKTAPVLILGCFDQSEPKDGINHWATYDLGAAVMALSLQAAELGYYCRQIGSFDTDLAKTTLPVPDPFQPFVIVALGKIGTDSDYAKADPNIVRKDLEPHPKKPTISQILE